MIIYHAHTGTTLLNILNLKANQMDDEISDIYISNSERMPQELIQFTRDSGLFRNVIVINPYLESISENHSNSSKLRFIINKANKATSLLRVHQYYEKILSQSLSSNKCDILITHGLWLSSPYIVNYFYSRNNALNLHIIDEGIGTTNESFQVLTNPKRDELSPTKFHKMVYDFFWFITTGRCCNQDIANFRNRFTDYYLYTPEYSRLYQETSLIPHKLLPFDSNNKLTPLLGKLLEGINYDEYINRHVWILSDNDVLESHPCHLTFKRILEITLASFSQDDVILKGHPALHLNEEYYSASWSDLYLDNRKFQLEALYSMINLDEKILITRTSSAVFYPKYMFNAEPSIIFTYKLLPNGIGIEAMDRLVASLRGLYVEKERIHVPESLDELSQCLKNPSNILK